MKIKITPEIEHLTVSECKKINGGGWLSDFVAQLITDLKCGCQGVVDGEVARSGVGSMVR